MMTLQRQFNQHLSLFRDALNPRLTQHPPLFSRWNMGLPPYPGYGSRQSQRVKGIDAFFSVFEILSHHFEKKKKQQQQQQQLNTMKLKLTEHVSIVIFLLYKF